MHPMKLSPSSQSGGKATPRMANPIVPSTRTGNLPSPWTRGLTDQAASKARGNVRRAVGKVRTRAFDPFAVGFVESPHDWR